MLMLLLPLLLPGLVLQQPLLEDEPSAFPGPKVAREVPLTGQHGVLEEGAASRGPYKFGSRTWQPLVNCCLEPLDGIGCLLGSHEAPDLHLSR